MGKDDLRFERLREGNYETWAYRMEHRLDKKDVLTIVNRTETRPPGSPNHKAVIAFMKRWRLAKDELVEAVDDTQLVYTRHADPADIWDALRAVHRASGMATRMQLRRQLQSIVKDPEQSMLSWITDVKLLVQQLKDLGSPIDDEETIAVLTKLPESYDPLMLTLDAIGWNKLQVTDVIAQLLNAEARQNSPKDTPDVGYYSKSRRDERNRRMRSGTESAPWKKQPRDVEDITCWNCQKTGHYAVNCPNPKKERANVAKGSDLSSDIGF